jgi:hypothetical protein
VGRLDDAPIVFDRILIRGAASYNYNMLISGQGDRAHRRWSPAQATSTKLKWFLSGCSSAASYNVLM